MTEKSANKYFKTLRASKTNTFLNPVRDKMMFFSMCCPICNSDAVDCVGIGKYFNHTVPTIYCKSCGSYFRGWYCSSWEQQYYNYQIQYSMTDLLALQIERQSNFIFHSLKDNLSKYKLLDVGCGAGYLLDRLRSLGVPSNNLLGIEPKSHVVDQAKKNARGIDIVCSRFELWAATHKNSVDFLILSHVLEHLIPPYCNFFSQCKQVLKPGGLIFVEVPHCEEEVTNPYIDGFWKTHVVSFSPKGLRTLLEFNGFYTKKMEASTNINLLNRYQKRIFEDIILSFNRSFKSQVSVAIENFVRLLFLECPVKIYQRYVSGTKARLPGYIIFFGSKNRT